MLPADPEQQGHKTARALAQVGDQSAHQARMVLEQSRLASHQACNQVQRITTPGQSCDAGAVGSDRCSSCSGLSMALQFVDGPGHRLNPEGIPTGEVAKQGAMA